MPPSLLQAGSERQEISMSEWRNEPAEADAAREPRPLGSALWRGFRGRCPNCGEGRLFRAYLKPVANCPNCGEDMSHQRADDAPPYFTMVIVGHIVVPIVLAVAMRTDLSNLTHLMIWLPLTLGLTLALLQPVKGATIALQWALYMHGFDGSANPDALAEGYMPRDGF
jgi:uncharacterized protein (DUF983 family)